MTTCGVSSAASKAAPAEGGGSGAEAAADGCGAAAGGAAAGLAAVSADGGARAAIARKCRQDARPPPPPFSRGGHCTQVTATGEPISTFEPAYRRKARRCSRWSELRGHPPRLRQSAPKKLNADGRAQEPRRGKQPVAS